jgi:hypothetical protein
VSTWNQPDAIDKGKCRYRIRWRMRDLSDMQVTLRFGTRRLSESHAGGKGKYSRASRLPSAICNDPPSRPSLQRLFKRGSVGG